MNDNLYVCEWNKITNTLEIDDECYLILTTYDFTHHPLFEIAQELSQRGLEGYKLAKGITEEQIPVKASPSEKQLIYQLRLVGFVEPS